MATVRFEVIHRGADWYYKVPAGVGVLLTMGGEEFGCFKNTGFSCLPTKNKDIRAMKLYLLRAARRYFGNNLNRATKK